ncbi:hypothetical protein BGM19_29155 [Streptomyces agglomeratus]|nr:hypothetical protein BGM19_29155 [Streptomyces agglomeratus]
MTRMSSRLSTPRRFGRGRISAVAAAAVVIITPAAIAALPDAVTSALWAGAGPTAGSHAPAAADAGAPAPGTPMRAGRLRLDLGAALGPAGRGVAAAPVEGAVPLGEGEVGLTVREGGRIAHRGGKLLGGKVGFDGGVRLSKRDGAAVTVTDFAVDLRTRVVTAKVGEGRPDTRFGVLSDARARLIPHTVTGDANIALGGRLVLDDAAAARLDAGLRAEVFGGGGAGGAVAGSGAGAARTGIDAAFEADADLDVDLAYALGLDAELGLTPEARRAGG